MTHRTIELDLTLLSPKMFEELTYDLLQAEGFKNVEWRDGGSDGGRDVVATAVEVDASGYEAQAKWFADAKLYSTGIGFDVIHSTLATATATSPDYVLIVAWPHLTPQSKDSLDRWIEQNRPRFRVRRWEKKDIERLLVKHPRLLKKYLPEAWTDHIEMDSYLREATKAFTRFKAQVAVVWKHVEGKPFTDSLRLVPRDKSETLDMIDLGGIRTDSEREFIVTLIDAWQRLEEVLLKTLNLNSPTVVTRVRWDAHPGIRLLVPIPLGNVVRDDMRRGLRRLLAVLEKNYSIGDAHGVVSMSSTWKPFSEKNRVAMYAFFPKRTSVEPVERPADTVEAAHDPTHDRSG